MKITHASELQPGHYITYLASTSENPEVRRRVGIIKTLDEEIDCLIVDIFHPTEYAGRIPRFFSTPHDEAYTTLDEIHQLYPEDFI